jgi:arylsulfatase A-like enzyme
VLKAEGYWTAGFANNINVAPVFNFQQGFDEYVYLEPSFYFGATESGTKLTIYKGLRVFRERVFGSTMYFPNYYQDAEVVNRRVAEWLDQKPPEPFFLFVHYMEPHDPYFEIPYNGRGVARVLTPNPPAERAAELHELYRRKVTFLDEHFKTLLSALRSSGLYDRSVIAVTADHGEEFQDHGGWWHGTTLYDEQLHVPFILKPTRGGAGGQIRTDVVRSIDIAPAMLGAAGVKTPPSFAGHDVMTGPINEPLYAEEDLEGNQLTSIRIDRWKLITANPGNPRGLATIELYDVEADPKEKNNLAGSEKDKVAELMAELQRIRAGVTRPQPRVGG